MPAKASTTPSTASTIARAALERIPGSALVDLAITESARAVGFSEGEPGSM